MYDSELKKTKTHKSERDEQMNRFVSKGGKVQ